MHATHCCSADSCMRGSMKAPAEDETLVHVVGINDSLQHPGFQTLHSLGPILSSVCVWPSLVKGMGSVSGGGEVGLQPGAVLVRV